MGTLHGTLSYDVTRRNVERRFKGEVGALLNRFKLSSKMFLLTVLRRCVFCRSLMLFLSCFCNTTCASVYYHSKAVLLLWIINIISVLLLLCFRARLFIHALWSPVGKGLTSWLFVMSNCQVVTFPLVSWVRCGA